jgi:hypothetical protein
MAERDGILSVRFDLGVCQYTIVDHPIENKPGMGRRIKVRLVSLDGSFYTGRDAWKSRWRYATAAFLADAYFNHDPEVAWLRANHIDEGVLQIWVIHSQNILRFWAIHNQDIPFELYGGEASMCDLISMHLDLRFTKAREYGKLVHEGRCDVCRQPMLVCSLGVVDHLDPDDYSGSTCCLGGVLSISR